MKLARVTKIALLILVVPLCFLLSFRTEGSLLSRTHRPFILTPGFYLLTLLHRLADGSQVAAFWWIAPIVDSFCYWIVFWALLTIIWRKLGYKHDSIVN